MKKHTFSILVGIVAFAMGILLAVLLQTKWNSQTPELAQASVTQEPASPTSETVGCKDSSSFPGLSVAISEKRKYKNGFFPVGAFEDGWQDSDSGKNDGYGEFLRPMGERSLFEPTRGNTEIYRFLWLRSFHHPISVRLERSDYSFKLVSVELSGKGGYEPGRKLRTDNIIVSEDEWCKFMSLLEAASFWSQPTSDPRQSGRDGAQWVLEGVRRNRYHIIDRWSPHDGGFRAAGIYLLQLSGRETEKAGSDIY
jgi:hypothetical protein